MAEGRKQRGCLNCGSRKSPQWRKGPGNAHLLCNACGVVWRRDSLVAQRAAEYIASASASSEC
jgi:hypothetical protein